MKQERFTEQAREVLAASQELVRRYRHSQWDVEHILMALLEQESGLTTDILQKLGVDVAEMKRRVAAIIRNMPKVSYEAGQIFTTPRVMRLLENSEHEADRLKDEFIGTEHLLIAVAAEGHGE